MYRKLPVLYNPREKEKERLIADFIVRQKEFKEIFDDLKSSKMETPEQHYLVVGQRGMGKTTLLYRLRYAVEDEKKLKKWLIPISFPEENYGIADLAGVWEYVAEYLSDEFKGFEELEAQMSELEQDGDFERNAFDLLISHLKLQKKKLVLLIDNFDTLLDKIGEEGKRLRQILQTCAEIRLVVASANPLEGNYQYDKEFFEFFREIRLKGISLEEIKGLFRGLAQTEVEKEKIEFIITKEPHRIEIMRILTGGVIRTMILLFEIFMDSEDGRAFSDLEAVLDHVTTLYKHRMDDLKPQQQLIVDAVARAWDSVSVKDLANDGKLVRNQLDSKKISAQLRALVKNGIIEQLETDTKNHLYFIRERFFNIWYLMRNTRKGGGVRILWLVRFYELWCSIDELTHQANRFMDDLGAGNYAIENAFFKGMALLNVKGITLEKKTRLGLELANFLEPHSKNYAEKIRKSISELIRQNEGFGQVFNIYKDAVGGDLASAYSKYRILSLEEKCDVGIFFLGLTLSLIESEFDCFFDVINFSSYDGNDLRLIQFVLDEVYFVVDSALKSAMDKEFSMIPFLGYLIGKFGTPKIENRRQYLAWILMLFVRLGKLGKRNEVLTFLSEFKNTEYDFWYYFWLNEVNPDSSEAKKLSKEKNEIIKNMSDLYEDTKRIYVEFETQNEIFRSKYNLPLK